jgi:hypothetical protein
MALLKRRVTKVDVTIEHRTLDGKPYVFNHMIINTVPFDAKKDGVQLQRSGVAHIRDDGKEGFDGVDIYQDIKTGSILTCEPHPDHPTYIRSILSVLPANKL